jgi:hypothetical protein
MQSDRAAISRFPETGSRFYSFDPVESEFRIEKQKGLQKRKKIKSCLDELEVLSRGLMIFPKLSFS